MKIRYSISANLIKMAIVELFPNWTKIYDSNWFEAGWNSRKKNVSFSTEKKREKQNFYTLTETNDKNCD